jgi:hypothetical protein
MLGPFYTVLREHGKTLSDRQERAPPLVVPGTL